MTDSPSGTPIKVSTLLRWDLEEVPKSRHRASTTTSLSVRRENPDLFSGGLPPCRKSSTKETFREDRKRKLAKTGSQ